MECLKKQNKKVLFFDVETTGVKAEVNGVFEIGFVIEIAGKVVDEAKFNVQPFKGQIIEKEALDISGMTLEKLKTFPLPGAVHKGITGIWNKHVDRFDKSDKFYPAGYNVRFDLDFMSEFFGRNGDKYFGSYVNWKRIDPLPVLYWLDFKGAISLENYKLETVCEYFGIKIDAHDALSDIKATRELIEKVDEFINSSELIRGQ